MKKSSQVLVLAMSAVFALTACERRTRPAKPKQAQNDKDKKAEDGKTPPTTPGNQQPGATNNPGGAQPVAEVKKSEREIYENATMDLFVKGFETYAKQGFATDEIGTQPVEKEGIKLPQVTMNVEKITKRIQETAAKLAEEAVQAEITPKNEDALAQDLSDALTATKAQAQSLLNAYRDEKGQAKAVKDVDAKHVQGMLEVTDGLIKSIDTLQDVLTKDFAVKLK